MPDFDPNAFLAQTAPSRGGGKSFDPDAFLAKTSETPHDLVPFLKAQGSNLSNMAGNATDGLVHAVMHPVDTASDVANSLTGVDAQGLYRAVRNVPVAGPAIDSIVSSAHALAGGPQAEQNYQNEIAKSDAQHAKEHPLTDFIQRSVGTLPFATEQAGMIAADAFGKSLKEGNDTWTAMKDARNALVLTTMAVGAGHVVSSGIGKLEEAIPKSVGISPEAMALNAEKPGLVNEAMHGVQNPVAEAPLPEGPASIPNFPTKEQLGASLHPDEMPPASIAPQEVPTPMETELSKQFMAGNNEGTTYANLGQKLGGAVGGGSGAILGHGIGAAVGVPVGMAVGKGIGHVIDVYGAPAVKMAMDAGVMIEKIADTPFIGPIMKSAMEGPKSLAVTHYMLSQTSPEYQAAMGDQKH